MLKLDVLMTSHNRCSLTVACLSSLLRSLPDADLHVILVDAGSTDGTRDRVCAEFPGVSLVEASSDVYWGEGMRIAGQHAPRRRQISTCG